MQGISLTVEQFSSLVMFLPEIESMLRQAGESIPRPDYGTSGELQRDSATAEKDEDAKSQKKNHEATSDEGEDAE